MNDNNTIQLAAVKGRTVWLQNLLKEMLPQLNQPSTDYQTWFNSVIEVMEHRGLTQPTQQKDYLSDIRNAIKVLDPNHPALEIVDFDTSTWVKINNYYSDRVGERKTKFIDHPDAIVKRATTLLGSYQWSEIAAGLAVVTGRRCTEVIQTAQFKYKSSYSLTFTGALKRGDEPVECVFEIPTLCEAQLVLDAISNLRSQLGEEIQDLSKRQVSRRYGRAVAKKCDRYFDELVPPREDKDNLYTHLFRAVYATIASYWYCPPTIPEIEFRAAIQGHYQIIDERDPKLRRSIAADRNYFDYRISDGHGNIDGRLGIKLSLPDVEVIEEFQSAVSSSSDPQNDFTFTSSISPVSGNNPSRTHRQDLAKTSSVESNGRDFDDDQSKIKPIQSKIMDSSSTHRASDNSAPTNSTSIPSFFQSRLSTIADKLGISHDQTIQALFTWTEMGLSLAEHLEVEELTPQAIFESVQQLKTKASHNLSSVSDFDSTDSARLDSHSLNQLSTSVRLLSEALYRKQHRQSSESILSGSATMSTPQDRVPLTSENSKSSDESSSPQVQQNHRQQADELTLQTTKSQSISSKSSNKEGSSRKVSLKGLGAEKEVNRAIDAIIEFNNQENLAHKDKWQIGVSALRKLTQRGDSVTKRVLESRATEIEQHHAQHQIGKRHNSKGKTYPSIDELISL